MNEIKCDARTGEQIRTGQRYRTYYRGLPHECYLIYSPGSSSEQITEDYLRRHPEHAGRVPPVETMS